MNRKKKASTYQKMKQFSPYSILACSIKKSVKLIVIIMIIFQEIFNRSLSKLLCGRKSPKRIKPGQNTSSYLWNGQISYCVLEENHWYFEKKVKDKILHEVLDYGEVSYEPEKYQHVLLEGQPQKFFKERASAKSL